MKNWALDTIAFFEGQFEGRGLFRRPENLHFSLWRTSQVGSHRLRQETLLKRIFNNQRSPLAMKLRAFLFLSGKFVSPIRIPNSLVQEDLSL